MKTRTNEAVAGDSTHRLHPLQARRKLRSTPKEKSGRSLWFLLAGLVLSTSALLGSPVWANSPEEYKYSDLLQEIDAGEVTKVEINPVTNKATVYFANSNSTPENGEPKTEQLHLLENNTELIQKIRTKSIELEIKPSKDPAAVIIPIANIMLIVFLLVVLVAIIRRSAASSGQALNFGKSRARFQMEAQTGIMFDDVAGIEEAKEELQEVVTFLKETERFTSIGARIPKGVLLIGPPGTGKTLLAKAVAGEAEVPFFSISGSEFVEMFVGVGASRVRDLFKKAKENAPCLIFIDEIDAVGRQRGAGYGGGNDEREQTLNQLLTEMDGFEGNTGVIVIAATNRPDVLDNALLRPGRFDRQVTVDLPDRQGRLGILEVHARTKKLSSEVSLEFIARRTPGFSGADLANLLNEAAILTARRRKDAITSLEIDDAIDRITVGLKLTPLLDSKKKRMTAYHEVGHALLATLLEHADPLNKVTIIPRSGGIEGFSQQVVNEETADSGLYTRAWLLDRITVALGGRAADAEVFGEDEIDSGAANDIQKVTDSIRSMVTLYGMSDLGAVALEPLSREPLFGGGLERPEYSEEIAVQIDRQIREIAFRCYEKARRLIREHRPLVDRLVDVLLDAETLEGEQFRQIVAEHVDLPKSQLVPTP